VPRVLILATTTGYQTRAFGDAAQKLGISLVFATDRCHMLEDPWQDGAVPIRFHEEDISAAAVLEASRSRPFDGVIAVGDRPTVIAARLATAMGLPGHSPEAAAIARDKQRTRERLREAGLPVPWFLPASLDVDPVQISSRLSYPCVVKPVALSASRGVIRADDLASLRSALARLRALMQLPDIRAERNPARERILIEGFIPGREYAVEGVLHHGRLKVLAVFDKPDPLDGPFFEETIYLTPSSLTAEVRGQIERAVSLAASAIGLRHGPIHAECRANEQGVFVIEVAARPIGGLCARALRFNRSGERDVVSLEELLLRHATGQSIDSWSREESASGVMMIPIPARGIYRSTSGLVAARAVDGIDDVVMTAKVDQLLMPLPEGSSYLGFIFAHGESPSRVDRALRAAHGCLRVTIEPELRVLGSGTNALH
jgi:ATP-grasp domain-containing protein/L-aminoacid ligase-like protein